MALYNMVKAQAFFIQQSLNHPNFRQPDCEDLVPQRDLGPPTQPSSIHLFTLRFTFRLADQDVADNQLPFKISALKMMEESKAKAEADGRRDWQDGWIDVNLLKETVLGARNEVRHQMTQDTEAFLTREDDKFAIAYEAFNSLLEKKLVGLVTDEALNEKLLVIRGRVPAMATELPLVLCDREILELDNRRFAGVTDQG
jgi:hypothetical protein